MSDTLNLRPCGPCYACCVHLGIDELKKWPGTSCKHLDGSLGSETRCSIYYSRPHACVRYQCAWTQGIGEEDLRPDKSGLLISIYPERVPGVGYSCTIMVIDSNKAGTINSGPLNSAIQSLVSININDIAIINYKTKEAMHLLQGQIRTGKVLPAHNPEGLELETFDPPIGTYETQDIESNNPGQGT